MANFKELKFLLIVWFSNATVCDISNDLLPFIGSISNFKHIFLTRHFIKSLDIETQRLVLQSGTKSMRLTETFLTKNANDATKMAKSNVDSAFVWNYSSDNNKKVQDILDQFGSSTAHFLYKTANSDWSLTDWKLDIKSKVFIVEKHPNDSSYTLLDVYKIHPSVSEVKTRMCGTWNPSTLLYDGNCPFTNHQILEQRANFDGFEITSLYDAWEPYTILSPDQKLIGGVFPEIFNNVANALNFSVRYKQSKIYSYEYFNFIVVFLKVHFKPDQRNLGKQAGKWQLVRNDWSCYSRRGNVSCSRFNIDQRTK